MLLFHGKAFFTDYNNYIMTNCTIFRIIASLMMSIILLYLWSNKETDVSVAL